MQIHERSTGDCLQGHISYSIKFIEMIYSKLNVYSLIYKYIYLLHFNVVVMQDVLFLLCFSYMITSFLLREFPFFPLN